MSFDWAYINTALILMVFFYGFSRWNGPSQDIRFRSLEDDQKMLRVNVRRLEHEVSELQRTANDTNDRILRELEAIRMNGAKEHPIEEKITGLENSIFELERIINAMPCAYHANVQVNGKKEPPCE